MEAFFGNFFLKRKYLIDLSETFRILYCQIKVDDKKNVIKKERQITELYGLMPSPLATQLFRGGQRSVYCIHLNLKNSNNFCLVYRVHAQIVQIHNLKDAKLNKWRAS